MRGRRRRRETKDLRGAAAQVHARLAAEEEVLAEVLDGDLARVLAVAVVVAHDAYTTGKC